MGDKEVAEWISVGRSKGYSLEALKNELIKTGYTKEYLDGLTDNKGVAQKALKVEPARANSDSDGRESNSLTTDDFQALENKEEKKRSLLGLISSKAKAKDKQEPQTIVESAMSVSEISHVAAELKRNMQKLMMDLEKCQGKIEMQQEQTKIVHERLTDLAEQIGDLRTTILDRERYFDKMESQFTSMKEMIAKAEPDKVHKRFLKMEEELLKKDAIMEKSDSQLKEVREEFSSIRKKLDSIRSFENINDILKEIKQISSTVEERKNYVDRATAKIEVNLENLENASAEIMDNKKQISSLSSLNKDILKQIDKIEVKLGEVVPSKNIDKLNKDVEILKACLFKKELENFQKNIQKCNTEDGP